MIRFRMNVAGEVVIDRAIARFADGITDYRPVWSVIADSFYALEKRQFESEGAAGGARWQELSPAYAKYKGAQWPGKPILQRTGRLYGSLTERAHSDAVYIEAPKTLTVGSRVPYGIYHQSIAPRTSALPRRPMVVFTEAFKREAMRMIQQYMVQIAKSVGFRAGQRWQTGGEMREQMGRLFGT